MDDIVKRAMAKWPNVPDCFNWLGLDRRGNWCLRDDATQALGPFPMSRGDVLEHTGLIDFIGRNYAKDDSGRWFFQNGPQRVYVELEATPIIWRIDGLGAISAHHGVLAQYERCLMDERGWAYLQTSAGFGLVHTQDVHTLAAAIEHNGWQVEDVLAADLPHRFGYCTSPMRAEPP
jgi:hypothetical protein